MGQITLTEIQMTYLMVLNLLGMKYLARDFDNDVYAFPSYPEKGESTDYQYWMGSTGFNLTYADRALKVLSPLCSWKDEEPLNIDKTLVAREVILGK